MQNDSSHQLEHQDESKPFVVPEKDIPIRSHKMRNLILSITILAGSVMGTYGVLSVITPKKVAQSSVSKVAETAATPERGTISSVEADISTATKSEEQIDDSLVSQDIEGIQAEAVSTQDLEGGYGDF